MSFPVQLGGPIPPPTAPWDTAGNIINDAAVELGLSPVSDPYVSTDSNFVQLCRLMKSLGRDLWRERQWTQLQQTYSFTTVTGTAQYNLPGDFGYMLNQTGWNRTTRLPLGGPLSPQEWQYLKARLVGVVFTVLFRPMQQQLWLYPDTATPGGHVIAFEYISRWWVRQLGQGAANKDQPSASTDTLIFDPQLLLRGLKLAFLKAKGFDTTTAQADYDRTLEQVKGDDSMAPVLKLGRSTWEEPLLGERNIPLTGFGT